AAGPPARYNTTASGAQQQASVASDAYGNAVAVWFSSPGYPASPSLVARRLDAAGIPTGAEITVNTAPVVGSYPDPEVAADANGNFTVVWSNQSPTIGSLPHVYRRRFDAAGTPLDAELRLDDAATSEAGMPAIAMNASGASVVAWYAYGGGTQIRARRYDASGAPVGAEILVATMSTVIYGPQIRVGLDDGGRFSVIWTEDKNNGANYDVYRRRFDASGTALGAAQRVNSAVTGPQRKADIAMDAAGNSVVIWDSLASTNNFRIVGQRYDSNGFALGGEFVMAYQPSSSLAPSHAAVSMARASGEFAATWRRADGKIYLRRYSAAGVAYGDEIAASVGGMGNTYPRLASDADGDVSLLWRDDESFYSNDFGVSGRRHAGQSGIDLAVDLVGSVDTTNSPAVLQYDVAVTNLRSPSTAAGVGSATGIVALVDLPDDATLLNAGGSGWHCDTASGAPRCTYLAPLPAGATAAPLHIEANAGSDPAPVASVQIAGNQYDAVGGNDSDTLVLPNP
ncbi:MAG TPA: hypothetical protein VN153_01885, partial [Tahibacter sp.]|nr:hypothetical protein [Tahibacter sp.]